MLAGCILEALPLVLWKWNGEGEEVGLGDWCDVCWHDEEVKAADSDVEEEEQGGFDHVETHAWCMEPEEGTNGHTYHGVDDEEEAVIFIPDLIQGRRAQNIEHQEAQNTNDDNRFAQFLQDYAGAEEDVPVKSDVDVKQSKDDLGESAVVRVKLFVGGLEDDAEGRVAVLHDEGVVKWELGSGNDSKALGEMVVVYGELVTSFIM